MEILRTKKIFFIWCLLSPLPVLATGINSGVSDPACDNSVMGTYSGNVALEAEYEANGIPIQWYDNNEEMTVSSAASSCDYGGNVTVAQNPPSRTGYVFLGWNLLCGFENVDTSVNGNGYLFKSIQAGSGGHSGMGSEYNAAALGTWGVWFYNFGKIFGEARCSTDSTTQYQTGTPANDNGQHCWCRITSYSLNTIGGQCAFPWIYHSDFGSSNACRSGLSSCANACAMCLRDSSACRTAFYSSVGQDI